MQLENFLNQISYPTDDIENIDPPVIEETSKNQMFVKFMSDQAKHDAAQGDAFEQYLQKYNVKYERTADRKFLVDGEQFTKLFPTL